MAFHLKKTWILKLFTEEIFVPSLVVIGPVVLDMKIFEFRQCISLFRFYLPLEKGVALHLNSHPRKNAFFGPTLAFWW